MSDVDEEEPLFYLKAAQLHAFDQRMSELIEFACTVYISSEVRDECLRELEEAKRNHYRIPKIGL